MSYDSPKGCIFAARQFLLKVNIALMLGPKLAQVAKSTGGGQVGRRTVFRWRRREVCWS